MLPKAQGDNLQRLGPCGGVRSRPPLHALLHGRRPDLVPPRCRNAQAAFLCLCAGAACGNHRLPAALDTPLRSSGAGGQRTAVRVANNPSARRDLARADPAAADYEHLRGGRDLPAGLPLHAQAVPCAGWKGRGQGRRRKASTAVACSVLAHSRWPSGLCLRLKLVHSHVGAAAADLRSSPQASSAIPTLRKPALATPALPPCTQRPCSTPCQPQPQHQPPMHNKVHMGSASRPVKQLRRPQRRRRGCLYLRTASIRACGARRVSRRSWMEGNGPRAGRAPAV